MSLSDAHLLEQLRAGNDEAFSALFLAYYGSIYRFLLRVVGGPEEAEDLAQEVFIKLYRQPPGGGQHPNVRAWLYRVALNHALNARRSTKRQAARDERVMTLGTGVEPDPAEDALREERRAQVWDVLRSLAPRQQQCLLLRHEGFSYAEIAEVIEVAPGSVGTMLARAEAEFARRYRERWGGAEE